jgi:hypothetical protein
MMKIPSPEAAESIPLSRANIAAVLGIRSSRVNNWIDRNRLWQTDRGEKFHRSYCLAELFDLAGFGWLRTARIPEAYCARFVYNYGFYRTFLHGDQQARFSYRNGKWDLGIYDPNAPISLSLNLRTIAEKIFNGISQAIMAAPTSWPEYSFECFRSLYREAVKLERLTAGSAPLFEQGAD